MFVLKENAIEAFKVFDENWKCRGYLFTIGGEYHQEGKIRACNHGFHGCKKVQDCFNYYAFDSKNKIAKVLMWGEVDDSETDKLCCSNIIIVGEITWQEMLIMANQGKNNVGHSNTGDRNTGYSNTGDRNTGYSNTGDRNTGDSNTGDSNTGDSNTGDSNTGDSNTGYRNTGDSNTGDSNTGNWNTGDSNTGNWNTGHRNTGYSNTGDSNTGNGNTGDWNTGDWNNCHKETGFFNTINSLTIRVFNKECLLSDWEKIKKPNFLLFDLTYWDDLENKTKSRKYKDAFQLSYASLCDNEKTIQTELLKQLPNFDADVFFEISGIRID